uniref:Ig-like domain-containing protein n=1 Tax=Sphaeramia orbicularis TaxID=375764 RepID=A0A673CQC0_9TELE
MVITLAVQTQVPQIQPPKSTDIAVYMGKSVTLDCFASGKPTAQISWILPDRTFNGTLQIHSKITLTDEGKYVCVAQNSSQPRISSDIKLCCNWYSKA